MKTFEYNKSNNDRARQLRRDMTKEEKKLWYQCLKKLSVTFRRQKAIGNYIVDFYCAESLLVIELDGGQHFEEKGEEYDRKRDKYLNNLGLTVIRYSNLDINCNFGAVCQDILKRTGAAVKG